jgi:hypothetical protein
MALSKTARMRCRTREAVSGLANQIGSSTPRTSDATIADTGKEPMRGKTQSRIVLRHC